MVPVDVARMDEKKKCIQHTRPESWKNERTLWNQRVHGNTI
jgi:hypothetical protein